jgi:hypothetical protein
MRGRGQKSSSLSWPTTRRPTGQGIEICWRRKNQFYCQVWKIGSLSLLWLTQWPVETPSKIPPQKNRIFLVFFFGFFWIKKNIFYSWQWNNPLCGCQSLRAPWPFFPLSYILYFRIGVQRSRPGNKKSYWVAMQYCFFLYQMVLFVDFALSL